MIWKRASTPAEKSVVLRDLENAWNVPPDMRLGQLIYNAVSHWLIENKKPATDRDVAWELFGVEDDDLMTTIAKFVHDKYPPTASTS